jgi:hypothetical protein
LVGFSFVQILTPEWVFHSWLHHFSGEANTTKKIRNSALIVLESDKLLDIEAFAGKHYSHYRHSSIRGNNNEVLLEKYNY